MPEICNLAAKQLPGQVDCVNNQILWIGNSGVPCHMLPTKEKEAD